MTHVTEPIELSLQVRGQRCTWAPNIHMHSFCEHILCRGPISKYLLNPNKQKVLSLTQLVYSRENRLLKKNTLECINYHIVVLRKQIKSKIIGGNA